MKDYSCSLIVFILCYLGFYTHIFSQENSAFQSGEWLRFKVRYGIFNASFATLEIKDDTFKKEEVYHVIGKGATTGLARLFFKVDDTYESYFSKKDGFPRYFIRNIYEGGYTKHLQITFDRNNQKAKIKNIKKDTITYLPTPKNIHDIISGVYWLRNYPEINNIKEGKEIAIDMIYDDDEVFHFKLRCIGREKIKTKFGTVPTLIFLPLVKDGRVFKEQESLTVWISDDANRIPLKIKASLRVGALIAELDDFKGLKHISELKK